MTCADAVYSACLSILKEELVPAMGCTEPIALAYASAKAAEVLGCRPERLQVLCSGNVIKNVKGVKVPNADGQKGVEIASILGAIGGDANLKLEVLQPVSAQHRRDAQALSKSGYCQVDLLEGSENLHIRTTAYAGESSAVVEIYQEHTNIVLIKRNDEILLQREKSDDVCDTQRSLLNLDTILSFADCVKTEDIAPILDRQIAYNTAIANEGVTGNYGANVGKTLLQFYGDSVWLKARAAAAAGSDARMAGCTLPVVINSGSGNQGLTASLPVIAFADEYGKTKEELYRALAVSNLLAIHQKTTIGKLSAYCGAVSAACASGAAIAYLMGESRQVIAQTLKNTLGNVAGIVCDGAKASCASKIASSVEAALNGYLLAKNNNGFESGDGLILDDVEQTICNYGHLAKVGMLETDRTILHLMIGKSVCM